VLTFTSRMSDRSSRAAHSRCPDHSCNMEEPRSEYPCSAATGVPLLTRCPCSSVCVGDRPRTVGVACLGCCTPLLYGLSAWELDCHVSLTSGPQVRRHLRLSVGTRHVPLLTLRSGTQRARLIPARLFLIDVRLDGYFRVFEKRYCAGRTDRCPPRLALVVLSYLTSVHLAVKHDDVRHHRVDLRPIPTCSPLPE
jgi:hypothetical protein